MKILSFLILVACLASGLAFADVKLSKDKCELNLQLSQAGFSRADAILGDCYFYGILFEKDFTKAQSYYMQASLNGEAYGEIRSGLTLLVDGRNEAERYFGLYILNSIVKNKSSDYRGYAAYYLYAYFLNNNNKALGLYVDEINSTEFLDLAYAALYARDYTSLLEDNVGIDPEKVARDIASKGVGPIYSFSCWAELQQDRYLGVKIPKDILDSIYKKHGRCKRIEGA